MTLMTGHIGVGFKEWESRMTGAVELVLRERRASVTGSTVVVPLRDSGVVGIFVTGTAVISVTAGEAFGEGKMGRVAGAAVVAAVRRRQLESSCPVG